MEKETLQKQLDHDPSAQRFFQEDMLKKNFNMLYYFSASSILTSGCVFFANLFFHILPWNANLIYLVWSVASLIMFICSKLFRNTVLRYATGFLYLYTSVLILAAIISGTMLFPENTSGVMIGAITILPFILFDRYWRFYLYECCICLLFCLLSLQFKPYSIAIIDCANAIGFTALSCVMGMKTIQLKMTDIQSKMLIIRQRDTDPLTGLMTRAAVEKEIDEYCENSHDPAALFIMDMDGFKGVNDHFGHGKGDQVLIEIAQAIRDCFREEDWKARLGGDEFIVFTPHIKDTDWLKEVARQLGRTLCRTIEIDGESCSISVSMGISLFFSGETFESLYAKADHYLYQVKSRGKNGYWMETGLPVFFSEHGDG